MIIHILCRGTNAQESHLGVSMKTLMGDDDKQIGTGGSETGLLTLCEAWHNRGDKVVLYNNPRGEWWSPFEQKNVDKFDPAEPRDAVIVFRTPNRTIDQVTNCKKYWLSCDQATHDNYEEFSHHVDKVICISPRHVQFFKEAYHITNAIYIDLPVRVQDFQKDTLKIKNRFIFSSVPARGLDQFFLVWSKIKEKVPDASAIITADYRLWGHWIERSNGDFVAKSLSLPDISYPGAIKRPQYAEEVCKSDVLLYSATYDELFCVSVAEAQCAGVYTITTDFGALPTTNMCKVVNGDPRTASVRDELFEAALSALDGLHSGQIDSRELQKKAIKRFCQDTILDAWDKLVFNDI